MRKEAWDAEKKTGSASVPQKAGDEIFELNEKNLEVSLKKGLKAPYSKVMLRLMLSLLIIVSVALFVTSILKYSEIEREKEALENKKEALELEVEELQYLIDCPVDYDYIVRVARERLNLHLPDEIVYYNDYNE